MSDTGSRSPFTSRGFIFGAIIFGVLVLAAILLAVTSLGGGGGQQSAPATTATPTSAATPEADADAASVCGLPGYEESGTLTAAPVTEWTIVGTMAAPGGADVGPGATDSDGLRRCYAHTVEGALFATANIWAMGTNGSLGDSITDKLSVPGPGRDAAMARQSSNTSNGLSAQIIGFKTLAYTGDAATIDIAFRLNTGVQMSIATELRWSEGDWKVQLTDDGQSSYRPVTLQSLGGYVPWAGVE
ncbi:hypothetical protein HQQ82_19140 [Rathayibacter sp. VKM Ac-2856]|uniref:hypothetical protein n=1 Tax=unclassified Rathayibacter TaxID=2609250 RepID=UPI00156590E4|nr:MULTISPECIES: hypothetical protein [unclassified Rathayibacter]NQX06972.1 hypothetical protein [Rathayibacter sp. VKM Ac-2858]NQX22087.1 hypothetical protein [Rathayibacter sp. VKM Ac-2856]